MTTNWEQAFVMCPMKHVIREKKVTPPQVRLLQNAPLDLVSEDEVFMTFTGTCPRCHREMQLTVKKEPG